MLNGLKKCHLQQHQQQQQKCYEIKITQGVRIVITNGIMERKKLIVRRKPSTKLNFSITLIFLKSIILQQLHKNHLKQKQLFMPGRVMFIANSSIANNLRFLGRLFYYKNFRFQRFVFRINYFMVIFTNVFCFDFS